MATNAKGGGKTGRRVRKTWVYEVKLPNGGSGERRFRSVKDAERWAAEREGRSLVKLVGGKPKEKTKHRRLVRLPDGRYEEGTFDTKVEADAWKEDRIADRRQGLDRKRGEEPLGDLAERWFASEAYAWEAHTVEQARSFLRCHILPEFGKWPVGTILHSDVKVWVGRMISPGLSASTARRVLRQLERILEMAVLDHALVSNPCSGIRVKGDSQEREKKWLERSEVEKLVGAMPDHYAALVLTGCLAGLRFEEIMGLRRDRILRQIEGGKKLWQIRVDQATVEVGGRLIDKEPKSKKSLRTIPLVLFPGLGDVLIDHCDRYEVGPTDRVFRSPTGADLRRGNFSRRVLGPISEEALGFRVSAHDLRRTFGALNILAGIPVPALSKWMGHSSTRVTEQVYLKVLDEMEASAVALGLRAFPGEDWGTGLAGVDQAISGAESGRFLAGIGRENEPDIGKAL